MSKEREQVLKPPVICATCRKAINGPLIRRDKDCFHRPECMPDGSWAGWTVRKDAAVGELSNRHQLVVDTNIEEETP